MKKVTIVFFISFFLLSGGVWAGGWNNTLIGCRAMALGGAFAGLADDPSTIFYNPAGLAFQKRNLKFSIDGFHVWPTHQMVFDGQRAESKYSTNIPQIFISYSTGERLSFGFGVFVPYAGGGVDWKKDQLGFPFKSYLGIVSFTPTLAYRLNDKFSVGFNLNFYRGVLSVDTQMEGFGPMNAEENGTNLTGGIGFLYRPSEKIGIGLDIRGPTKMKLTGITSIQTYNPDFGTLKLNLDSETSFNLPWDIEFGLSYRFSPQFVFTTGFQYTMWSALKDVDKVIKNIPMMGDLKTSEPMNFKNIIIFRGGLEYTLPDGIVLRAGIGLDHSATPEATLSEKNIDVNKVSLLGGIGYKAGKMQIDFLYIYARGQQREGTWTTLGIPLRAKYNLNATILGLGITFSL